MGVDQDLSGDMVKVVQYTIVSVATDLIDDARIIQEPKSVAFGDDMTAADFTAWRLSVDRECISESIKTLADKFKDDPTIEDVLKNPKWYRIAFHVSGRFAPIDIDWAESHAKSLRTIAKRLKPPIEVEIKNE